MRYRQSFGRIPKICRKMRPVHTCLIICFLSIHSNAFSQNSNSTQQTNTHQITDVPVDHIPVVQSAPMNLEEPKGNSTAPTQEDAQKTEAEKRKKQEALAKKTASSHKPLFFDNDFSYLCDPSYEGWLLGDAFKKRGLPGGGSLDIGGQYRARYHAERNMRGLGLTGVDDDFLLHRTRIFANLQLHPDIRIYGEMLDAESNYENFGPRPIEVNRFEMQNLFVDARLIANGDSALTARVGRQELLFGAQRAVSPLDWANTRRTFEGARLIYKQKNRTTSAFWTNPMRIDNNSFDSPDRDQEFMGIYDSFTGKKNQTVDTYFLRLLNRRGANNFQFNTIGVRWQGSRDEWLWDCEAAYQFGDNTDGSSHVAGMATFGFGRKLQGCWKPTLWAYYDWASGDDRTAAGNGFHHNFPLAHKYNGFMDLFGRRNLEDINFLLTLEPTKKLKLLAWYHYFFLETQTDSPYSVVMTPFSAALPGSADLGHEIDFLLTYKIDARQNFVLGYSHFFSGDYYDTTAGVPFNGDANFFYTQWTFNF